MPEGVGLRAWVVMFARLGVYVCSRCVGLATLGLMKPQLHKILEEEAFRLRSDSQEYLSTGLGYNHPRTLCSKPYRTP